MPELFSHQRPLEPRLDWLTRWLLALLAGGLLTLLAMAVWLKPSPTGMGTHQQLGLPPCSITTIFKIRCPSCGMTTSWSHLVRGEALSALQANTGGTLLALLALAAAPWAFVSAVRGRWIVAPPDSFMAAAIASVITGVTLVDWLLRVWLL